MGLQNLSEVELLERVKDVSATPRNMQQSSTDLSLLNSDLMDMDFTDNLFSTLNQPFPFPNPREISRSPYFVCVRGCVWFSIVSTFNQPFPFPESGLRRDISRSSHTSDLKIGAPVATSQAPGITGSPL